MEEAGRLLRIGRTKAYAMAREWRETEGRSGLPVVDFGHVLRVPRRALEELIGAELPDDIDAERPEKTQPEPPPEPPHDTPAESPEKTPRQRPPTMRRSRRPHRIQNQLDLFATPDSS